MDQYHHDVSFVASIMVSYKVAMIIKQITVFSPIQEITIATLQPLRNTLNFSFMYL